MRARWLRARRRPDASLPADLELVCLKRGKFGRCNRGGIGGMKFRSTAGFRGLPSSCLHLEIFEANLHRLIPELLLIALPENARNRFSYRFRRRRRPQSPASGAEVVSPAGAIQRLGLGVVPRKRLDRHLQLSKWRPARPRPRSVEIASACLKRSRRHYSSA